MKKAISILLSVIIAFSIVVPAFNGLDFATIKAEAATSGAGDAYATLFTTSDLQNNSYLSNFKTIMETAREDGVSETPDALLFGGDFQTTSNAEESISHHMDAIERVFNDFYPYYHSENLVFIKGNHDALDDRHYETGLHEFDDFWVYVINENDYRAGSLSDAQTASANLKIALDGLLANNNDKPIFVMTHVPFHHNSRGGYGQSAYGRYLFEVLNSYGNFMDIVFMFGHNHSGTYDDYIGGSVNYLGVGDDIYISEYGYNGCTEYGETYFRKETLTFTYMNYGYAAYNNNTNGTVTDTVHGIGDVKSTNALTMGVLEICPDRIVVSRYSLDGKYGESEIIERKTPANQDGSYDEPYVNLAYHDSFNPGTQYAAYANATGFENPVYTWSSSHPNIANVTGNGPVAQVSFLNASNTTVKISVTVTEANDSSKRAEDSYEFKVTGSVASNGGVAVLLGDSDVTGETLSYYSVDLPYVINLCGHYSGANTAANQKWSSSNELVATVEDGFVTFNGSGTSTITYSVDINGTTNTASVTFTVSNGKKQDLGDVKYVQTTTLEAGKEYAIVIDYKGTKQIITDKTYLVDSHSSSNSYTTHAYYPAAQTIAVSGSYGSYTFTGDFDDYTWKAETSNKANSFYFRNKVSGNYFNLVASGRTYDDGTDAGTNTYYRSASFTNTPSTVWSYNSDYGVYFDGYSIYARNGYAETVELSDRIRTDSEKPMYFERVVTGGSEPVAHIELGGEFIENKTENIYNVKNDTEIRAYGNYTNFGSDVVETWTSTNTAVASISSDGTIDFTGVAGDTEIIYKIKSANVAEKTLTFTISAKTNSEHKRTFKLVDKIVDDRPYVFVRKNDVTEGEAYAMSTNKLTKDALFPEDIVVKHNPVKDYLYVEVPESEEDNLVWTTGGEEGAGFVFITTERSIQYTWHPEDTNGNGQPDGDELIFTDDYIDGLGECVGVDNGKLTTEYLGVQVTGMGQWGVTGSLYMIEYIDVENKIVTDFAPHMFVYSNDVLYSNHVADVTSSYGSYQGNSAVAYHSSGYFGVGEVNEASSTLLAFEEIFPEPTAVIESNYDYIGKNVTRDEVCPYQSEQLTAVPENFPDGTKEYIWSSNDTTVATVDQNGKVTYTGKAGVVEITLTIKNTSDVAENNVSDTQKVTITVNPSQIEIEDDGNKYYLTSENFIPGYEYVLVHKNVQQSDAAKNDGLYYAISNGQYNANVSKGEVTTVTEAAINYVENPAESTVWTAVPSGTDGYVYLVDQNGHYLSIFYHSGSEDVVHVYPSTEGQKTAGIDTTSDGVTTVVDPVDLPTDSFLIATDGKKLYSKQSGSKGVNFNYGSNANSVKRFSVSSSAFDFGIYGKKSSDVDYSNAYYLTNSLVPGNKYVVALSDVAGSTSVINNKTGHSSNGYDYLNSNTETVVVSGSMTYISDPAATSVWECFQAPGGAVYLKDQSGNYMVVVCDESTATDDATVPQGLTVSANLTDYDAEEYKIIYKPSSSGGGYFGSEASAAVGWYIYNNSGNGRHYSMRYSSKYYLYGMAPQTEDYDLPVTQIRVNDRGGTNKDVTGTVYNRYYIENGGTEQLLRYVANVNSGYSYNWTSSDTSIAAVNSNGLVTYTGKEGYVTISLTVNGTDLNGDAYTRTVSTTLNVFKGGYTLPEKDDPEYPYEGSVRVNKTASNSAGGSGFQNTGVTEIELGVTGVPVSEPLDIVIVLDHSSSMNGGTMLEDCIANTQEFALKIFDANPSNRVAVVTFDAFTKYYSSVGSSNLSTTKASKEAGIVTGNGSIDGAFVTATEEVAMMEQIEALITNNESNTNYDYGMKLAYDILAYAKDNGGNENQVVVFMSDGQPNQFNGLQINATDGIGAAWITGDESQTDLAQYLDKPGTYPAAKLFNTDGDNWYGVAIKTAEGQPTGVPDHELYYGYETGLGAKVFTIGYAVSDTYGLLGRMASSHANYYYAQNNLQGAYNEILNQIRQAASDAVVTDKMGDHFDVQFATTFAMAGSGNVTLTPAPSFEIGYWTLDNTGNRINYNVIETITFETVDGVLSAAYSSIIGNNTNCYDIVSSKITGRYVSYNLNTETFTWNVGEINRTELTLKYYACLEGAATGEREAGTFDTNEFANITYTNFRGNPYTKQFPVPTLAWDQAAVSYDFYLVNDAGQPVNLSGVAVPFTDRITIGREQTKKILLNSDGTAIYTLNAADELPEGYELFNPNASYEVVVSTQAENGSATIYDDKLTTYFRDGSNYVNVNGAVPNIKDYSNTAVSFAVKMSKGVIPDSIVIDYGLPVNISVLGNDYVAENGVITGVAKSLESGTELNNVGYTTSKLVNGDTSDVATTYGKVSVVYDEYDYGYYHLVYTPTTAKMDKEDVFYYEYKIDNTYYYASVTVIPAANIYYEETFMTFVDGKDGYKWEDEGTAITGKFQAEDRPGTFAFDFFDADNAYGEDSAYDDSYTYSLGSAKKTTVDAAAYGKEATAKFTFCGTGFDLFSVTSNDTGAVQVTVYNAGTTTVYKNFLVNTYYGYTLNDSGALTPNGSSALYQVPVISRRDFDYGSYDVVIKPLYSSAFDPNYDAEAERTDNDYTIYVDSVRIFNPANPNGSSYDSITDAYYKDGEYAPAFMEIRDTVLSADEFYEEVIENLQLGFKGSIFLDGNKENGIDQTALSTYNTQGPKNELYLGKGQAIAFTVSSEDKEALASLQLGMKVVSGGETAKVTIMNTSEKYPNSITLSGAHETFKNINSAVIWDQSQINYEDLTDNVYSSRYPIVIANTSDEDTVISLTSFKWAHTTMPENGEPAAVNFMVYDTTPEVATMALRNAMAANAETDEKTYNEDDITMEWSDDTFVEGKEATLKVSTPHEVVKVTVGGIEIDKCEIGPDGNKLWTYDFVVQQAGENAFEVIFYDYNGDASEPVMTETIIVEEAEDEPGTGDSGTDVPSDKESFIEKLFRFITDVFNTVLKFMKGIINYFWRVKA